MQLTVSLAVPEHGVFPPLEVLVRVHVASVLHVPEHVPQATSGFKLDQEFKSFL